MKSFPSKCNVDIPSYLVPPPLQVAGLGRVWNSRHRPSWRALTHGGTPRAAPRPPGQLCGELAAARSEAVIMATP